LISEGKSLEFIEKLLFILSKQNKSATIQMKIDGSIAIEKIAQSLLKFPEEFKTLTNFVN